MRRRCFLQALLASGILCERVNAEEQTRTGIPLPDALPLKPGIDWRSRMELGRHHLVSGLDPTGLPYFDVLLRRPYAEAAHDFPDFVDLVGRYWEASLIVQEVTARPVETEPLLRKRAFSLFEAEGLSYNPSTRFSYHKVDIWGLTRVLFALIRRCRVEGSEESRVALRRLIQATKKWVSEETGANPRRVASCVLLLLCPLAEASELLGQEEPLDFASRFLPSLRAGGAIAPDGRWSGHAHSHFSAVAGIVEFGHLKADRKLVDWGRSAFEHIRQVGTEFGWIPELLDRPDDCVGCETCAMMDYLDAAIRLARAGHHELWDLIERVTRNHLAESQVQDPTWLVEPPNARDTAITIQRHVGLRMLGAFAGWSSPIGILAYDEPYVNIFWKASGHYPWDHIKGGRIRTIQNCCGGSGLKAFYRVWEETSRIEGETLVVELPFDREFDVARVRTQQPFGEKVEVEVHQPLRVKVRVPRDARAETARVSLGGKRIDPARRNGYLVVDRVLPGEKLQVALERTEHVEQVTVGNPGFQQYRFEARWRGATVLKVDPAPTNRSEGFNHLLKRKTKISSRGDVEHPFYQRSG